MRQGGTTGGTGEHREKNTGETLLCVHAAVPHAKMSGILASLGHFVIGGGGDKKQHAVSNIHVHKKQELQRKQTHHQKTQRRRRPTTNNNNTGRTSGRHL